MSITITPEREATARALEAAARLIREHPDLPVTAASANPLELMLIAGSEAERKQEIDRIAALLGTEARYIPGTRLYGVTHRIGAGVAYRAYARVSRTEDSGQRILAAVGSAAAA